ncbi:F9C16.19 [Arabidopsis thaliana]|uniref:F9C16.19 n=1 Tax=Arabidopsis thaliana TaxID=3702 RepID=Q9LNZ9_ARATH|nr:F9C16.19 [Arabidopsis thaliana]
MDQKTRNIRFRTELATGKLKVHVRDLDGNITEENVSREQVWSIQNRRVIVDFNRKGQPIKDLGGLLSSWLGSFSYDLNVLPINYTDWRKVPRYMKEMAWQMIQEEETGIEPSRAELFISSRMRVNGSMICKEATIFFLHVTSTNLEMVEMKSKMKILEDKFDIVASDLQENENGGNINLATTINMLRQASSSISSNKVTI